MTREPLRIAVLVHNDVVRDARVRKEVRTLTEAGHLVDVYGFRRDRDDYPTRLDGARLILLDDLASAPRRKRLMRGAALVASGGLVVVGIVVLAWLLRLAPGDTAALLLVCAAVVLALAAVPGTRSKLRGLYGFLGRGPKWIKKRLRMRNILAWRYRLMAATLARQIPAGDYDVIHAHDMIALMAAQQLKAGNPKLRLIWDAHELYEHISYPYPGADRFMSTEIRAASAKVDAFLTISDSFSDYYAKTHSLPPAKVVMNATRHAGLPQDDGRLHRRADLSPDRRILLFQGGLSPHRGIAALLAAAPELPPDWSLVFMGWGSLQPEIEAVRNTLADAGRPDTIALIPPAPQDDLPAWTAGATLGAIPYENTNLNHLYCTPNKLWEYPNAGVPVLATDLVEMGRMIREWEIGLLLPREFDASDIVAAISGYDFAMEDRLRGNCARFSQEMSWSRFEPALLAAYDEVA